MRIGRHEIILKLNEGGMGEVFLARDSCAGVDRLVVIKCMLGSVRGQDRFREMFEREMRISAQLNHPNIAHVYEVGQHEGNPFFSMEYVHGFDLSEILACSQRRLPPAFCAHIAAEVAGGLHHAHTLTDIHGKPLAIVHRDVSPPNIRISHEGTVKVLDFGITKTTLQNRATTMGITKGKIPYLSPEQLSDADIDARADIFSLGNLLFEMLTYRRLFDQADDRDVLFAIKGGDLPLPSAISTQPVPEELDLIVHKALMRDRRQRYQTARQMQQDLKKYLQQSFVDSSQLEGFLFELFGDTRQRLADLINSGPPVPDNSPGPVDDSHAVEACTAVEIPKRVRDTKVDHLPPEDPCSMLDPLPALDGSAEAERDELDADTIQGRPPEFMVHLPSSEELSRCSPTAVVDHEHCDYNLDEDTVLGRPSGEAPIISPGKPKKTSG